MIPLVEIINYSPRFTRGFFNHRCCGGRVVVFVIWSSGKTWPSCVLSFVFIMTMTVVEFLTAFLITMSEFDLRSLIALRSSQGKLFRGLNSSISAS